MRPRLLALLEPWLGSLASLLVPGYAFMLCLGAIVSAMLIVDRTRRAGFKTRDTLGVLMATYASGLLGACAVPLGQGVIAWLEGGRLAAPTGMAAYGGLVGGTIGTVIALHVISRREKRHLDTKTFLDAGAPGVALGIFFARVGCFLAGCDYGLPTTSHFFGTTFPAGSHAFQDHLERGLIPPDALTSLPVHPTQLYEAAAGLLLWGITTLVPARLRFATLVIGYAIARSVIELFRGDASRGHIHALSTAQVFAIVTSAGVLVVAILLSTSAKRAPRSPRSPLEVAR